MNTEYELRGEGFLGAEFRPMWVRPLPGRITCHNWKCSAEVPAGSRASFIDVDEDDVVAVVTLEESGKLTRASISHLEKMGFKRSVSKLLHMTRNQKRSQ